MLAEIPSFYLLYTTLNNHKKLSTCCGTFRCKHNVTCLDYMKYNESDLTWLIASQILWKMHNTHQMISPLKGELYAVSSFWTVTISLKCFSLYIVRNEYEGLPIQLGRGRLGSIRPSDDVTGGSGTNQTSGSLSSLSCQTKKVELECDNLGFWSKVDSISVSSILLRGFAAIHPRL